MPGPGDDQRHAHAVLEHALLAQQAVAAQGQAVVGGEDDQRVVRLAGLLQGRENPPDLLVHVRDQAVVFGQLIADHGLGARPGRQVLVAAALHHAVVEGQLRQEVRGQRGQAGDSTARDRLSGGMRGSCGAVKAT